VLFNSFEFIVFFAIVYALYARLPLRGQNGLLLIASYVFYGSWDWRFLSLIWFSTAVDFAAGLAMERQTQSGRRRAILLASLVSNLGLLGVFKYFDFFASSLVRFFDAFGFRADLPTLEILLPVGISFYTFQTLSYTIDVYRGRMRAVRDPLAFAVFVAFFPQLVAGPIERASHLIPQVEKPREIRWPMVQAGAWLILVGYFKKVVVADNLAVFTARVFTHPESVHGLEIVAAVYAFAFQIYGDFSGYTDIARGTSKLMGFDIMENFRMPYFAVNPRDFWSRWHISLSTWLRDYLYIPLGGNRGGAGKTYRNLMLTMLLGGLWHGAAWHFVAWGLYHGVLLSLHRAFVERFAASSASRVARVHSSGADAGVQSSQPRAWKHVFKVVVFFQFTCIGWLLFAVRDLESVGVLARQLFAPFALTGKLTVLTVGVLGGLVLALDYACERASTPLPHLEWTRATRILLYCSLLAGIALWGAPGGQEFIYFQF